MWARRSKTLFEVACVGAIAVVSSGIAAGRGVEPPVVFLHYDYMGRGPGGYDLMPKKDGIELVVEAFLRHGVILVIDPHHTVLPYSPRLSFGLCNAGDADCANFFDLKANYFRPHGNQAWHYAIFGDGGENGLGGAAALPGYDFQVTNGPEQSCPSDGYDPCAYLLAGNFMHELGHNLDLRHGGDVDENFKPNYISVMNYSFTNGIWYAAFPARNRPIGLRLDYSDMVLPALDENHVDERIGLGGPVWSRDVSFYFGCIPAPYGNPPCGARDFGGFVPVAAGPVDWNQDGAIARDVLINLNALWSYQFTKPTGFDDWRHVRDFLGTPAYATGRVRPLRIVP